MTNKIKITLAAAIIVASVIPALAHDAQNVSGYRPVMAKVRHNGLPNRQWYETRHDPDAVFVGGSYAGSDPDPNIRAALAREFGRML